MIDENLPTFYLRASKDDVKHHASILLAHHGSDAAPAYSLRHLDPFHQASKNRYAAALYDSYNPEILFGEVLLIPEWTKPTLNKDEIRQHGGVPPPPQPILPTEFTIQLYNPDQQIIVKWNSGTWNTAPFWEFEMPQQTFRQPSASALDRTQDDPTASDTTPKLVFKWKKDGKLSKDYVCILSGKSTNPDGSRKSREPDITISLFKHFKELTIYEPNLSRVDVEDPKGLEVVLLLGAIVIREVYNTNMTDAFNISDAPMNTLQRPHQGSASAHAPVKPPRPAVADPRLPPTDPRSQWEIDAEAARLKKQVEQEERQRRRAEEAETKRVKKMVEEEQRRKKEKQKEIDRETERLRRKYGSQQPPQQQQQQAPHSHQQFLSPSHQPVTAYPPAPMQRPRSASPYIAHNLRPSPQPQGPYIQGPGQAMASASSFFPGSRPSQPQPQAPSKKSSSFWHIGRKDDQTSSSRLSKQRSVVF